MSSQKKRLERISTRYHAQFVSQANKESAIVRDGHEYLRAHGINKPDIVDNYRIGVVIDPLPGDEWLVGRLSIPYLSRRGGVKAIKYRALGDDKPKMAQYAGQDARIYNTPAWFAAGSAIGLAEGETDAICATECLGLPTIAIPGVDTWLAHKSVWKLIFKDFRLVVMLADGDPPDKQTGMRPGRELAKAVAETVGWRVRVVECPENQDVSSMVASGQADWFKGKLEVTDDDDE